MFGNDVDQLTKAKYYLDRGNFQQAEKAFKQALRVFPERVDIYSFLARAQSGAGKIQSARKTYQKAIDQGQNTANVMAGLADCYLRLNNTNKALEIIDPLLKREKTNLAVAQCFSRLCKVFGRCDEAAALIESIVQHQKLPEEDKSIAYFRLGHLYDQSSQYDLAFSAFKKANDCKNVSYSTWEDENTTNLLIQTVTQRFINNIPTGSKRKDKPIPVFIVGIPRSGTSLVEQILAGHSKVFAAGELSAMMDIVSELMARPSVTGDPTCLSSLSQAEVNNIAKNYFKSHSLKAKKGHLVTDKMPGNYQNLGVVQILFPQAKIIHCKRNPIDTCLSCYFLDFAAPHPSTYNLSHLAKVYKNYEKLMGHWKQVLDIPIFDLQYESLVENPENQIRELLAFLGLNWEKKCLSFHQNKRVVATASYDQVKQPLYKKSVHRWKNYRKHIESLIEELSH